MKVEVDLVCDCRWWMAFGHTRSVDSLPVALPCVTVYPFSWNFPVLFSENSSCCSACFCWCSHQSWCSVAVTLILLHQRTAGIRMQLQSNASSLITHNYETLMWQTIVLSPREMTLFPEWHSCFIFLFVFFVSVWCIWRRWRQIINTKSVKSSTCYVAIKKQENKKYIDHCDDFQVAVFPLMISSSSSQSLWVKFWITLEINIISTCREMLKFTFYLFFPVNQSGFYIVSAFLFIFFNFYISRGGCRSDKPLLFQWHKGHRFNPRFMSLTLSTKPQFRHLSCCRKSLLPDWLC